jgi:predicted DNA-binding protein
MSSYVGFRLPENYEQKLQSRARSAGVSSSAYVRRALIADLERQEDQNSALLERLTTLERSLSRLERMVTLFLENAEIIDLK